MYVSRALALEVPFSIQQADNFLKSMYRQGNPHLPPLCASNYPTEKSVFPSAGQPDKLRRVDSKRWALRNHKELKNWVLVNARFAPGAAGREFRL